MDEMIVRFKHEYTPNLRPDARQSGSYAPDRAQLMSAKASRSLGVNGSSALTIPLPALICTTRYRRAAATNCDLPADTVFDQPNDHQRLRTRRLGLPDWRTFLVIDPAPLRVKECAIWTAIASR